MPAFVVVAQTGLFVNSSKAVTKSLQHYEVKYQPNLKFYKLLIIIYLVDLLKINI